MKNSLGREMRQKGASRSEVEGNHDSYETSRVVWHGDGRTDGHIEGGDRVGRVADDDNFSGIDVDGQNWK